MVFREDELIRFGDALVCGRCKPLFVQRLREGVAPAGELVYAGFWIRFGAKFIDGIVLSVATLIIQFVVGMFTGFQEHPSRTHSLIGGILPNILSFALNVAYVTYFLGKFGATPGKMALGLKVLRADGETITYARASGRFFAELLSSAILAIGYIMAAFDEEKRALHDRVCDTRVVRQA
jgi:uncharacterized RDD family membrane protein YckC